MHHRNHNHSSANHNNAQHHKNNNNLPSMPSPGGASTPKKSGVLASIRDRFKEKHATADEVAQLKLDAQREVYKTQKVNAKRSRPSRFENILGGGGSSSGGGRSSRRSRMGSDGSDSFLFGGGGKSFGNSMFESSGESPSLNMFKWDSGKQKGKKNQKSGIDELFGSG